MGSLHGLKEINRWLGSDLVIAVRDTFGDLCEDEWDAKILTKNVRNRYEFMAEEYLKYKEKSSIN